MADNRTQIVITARDDTRSAINTAAAGLRNLESAAQGISGKLAGLGVALSIGAAATFAKNMVSSAAALDDMAEKTGASVEELSKLEQVWKRGGHSAELVEQSMIRLSKALYDTGEGSQKAAKALAAIGLSAEQLRGLDTAEAMRIIAVSLNKFEDGAAKTALAMDLLGKSGAQALPFLKDLAEAGELNATVTAEQAAEAEKYEKALAGLAASWEAMSRSIVLSALPSLNKWLEANREGVRIAGSYGEMLRLFVFNLDAITTERPVEEIRRLQKALDDYQNAGSVGKFIQSPTGTLFGGREEDLKKQIEFLKYFQREEALALTAGSRGRLDSKDVGPVTQKALSYETAAKKIKKAAGEVEDYEARIQRAVGAAINDNAITKSREFADQLAFLDKLFFDAGLDVDIYRAALDKLSGATDKQSKSQERLNELLEATPSAELEKQRNDMILLADAYEVGRISAEKYFEAVAARLPDLGKGMDQMTEFAKQAAANMQDAFSSFFFNIMQGKFDDMASNFKATIDRMVADLLASQLLKYLLGDFGTTGKLGGALGGWIGELFGSARGNVFGPGGVHAFAAGGVVSTPTVFPFARGVGLMGEAGPEAIMPLKRGADGKLGVAASGGAVAVYNSFTINGATDRRSQQQIAAEVGAAVERAMRRNG